MLSATSCAAATQPSDVAQAIGFSAAVDAISDESAKALLGDHGERLSARERAAAAVLVATGMIEAADLDSADLPQQLSAWRRAATHPDFQGAIGDVSLIDRLAQPWDHTALLEAQELLAVLGEALTAGVLTGYDLRRRDVYAGFPAGQTFIYSHSSAAHLQQLATMLALHDVEARMFVAPKVSAFLFRDDWGTPGENVKTLPSGARVIEGREVAVLFEFDSPDTRPDFHDVVLRYAKKDEADEAGLIEDAWWQPFYYTDQPFQNFASISLVIVTSEQFEATLTVLHERSDEVVEAVSGRGFPVRVERVWVNPAFHRFLQGDYR